MSSMTCFVVGSQASSSAAFVAVSGVAGPVSKSRYHRTSKCVSSPLRGSQASAKAVVQMGLLSSHAIGSSTALSAIAPEHEPTHALMSSAASQLNHTLLAIDIGPFTDVAPETLGLSAALLGGVLLGLAMIVIITRT